jgi:hypothetical protein
MACERQMIQYAHGVSLIEIAYRGNGEIVDRGYYVSSLKNPELFWNFASFAEAEAHYLRKVAKCEASLGVQTRLSRFA